jgi:hypothetical protein
LQSSLFGFDARWTPMARLEATTHDPAHQTV